ncbi:MAG: fibrobacter succinogenes major paralogous domain-containing protein, partial [Candidatus Symbiothrix sp.]|nr:fibrobacter succinogenes major paralogous domain-containing protein [Candidatus Symbiothrix sp.]
CGTPFTAPSGKVYNTAAYSNANLTNLCWTTTNLQEAGYSATCYSNNCGTYPTRGYYYSVGANPDKACAALNSGDGSVWRVPTGTEWAALQTAFPSLAAGTGTTGNTAALQADWNGTAAMTGDSTSGSGWYAWGGHGNWWAQGTSGLFTGINSGATTMYSGTGTYWLAVRCVRSL